MADSAAKSKLSKRVNNFVQNVTETTSSGFTETERASKKTKQTRSADSGSAWWNAKNLSPVESLWALTLQSAIPYLDNQHWDQVPDLPPPSAAGASSPPRLEEDRWCDFSAEVPPFPQSRPPPESQNPDPLHPNSPQQAKSGAGTADSSLSSAICQEHEVSVHAGSKKDHPSLCTLAVPSSAREEEGRNEDREEKMETHVNFFDSPPLGKEEEISDEMMGTEEDVEMNSGDTKSGEIAEGKLNSCPMCLQVFPVGFSQMDCDGHLAQCLSEMNVDMAW
ncbi:uncharacterized protein si:ch73-70k4.1 [Dunckerocampus dactyliophorus]|uniref:uncharacterized protein si:ch73-70k4.1 n=1 Tax=Dunckerocampus dactyliophorus TaxID=161453 RepID=UPI002406FE30|nr:uncharacterized protein si:ch73-70k4.1 [Dunckerocampus dactyliophorus]